MKLNFYAHTMDPRTGYGQMQFSLWRALSRAGVAVVPTGSCSAAGFSALTQLIRETGLVNGGMPVPNAPHLYIGEAKHILPGLERVWLYTMSESTRVSQEWVDLINKRCDGVIVPAPALVGFYKESGVDVPVRCVPLGIDALRARLARRKKDFTFLTYTVGGMRKGAELAISAFLRGFGGKPEFKLIIKASGPCEEVTWLHAFDEHSQIRVVRNMGKECWHDLIKSADAFVFPSRGEGFGLPPREAVMLGVPTIATRWLGMWDVDEWGYGIGVKEMRPSQFGFWEANAQGGLWSEPDNDDLLQKMKWIVENYGQAIEHTSRGRRYLQKEFSWRKCALRVIGLTFDKRIYDDLLEEVKV